MNKQFARELLVLAKSSFCIQNCHVALLISRGCLCQTYMDELNKLPIERVLLCKGGHKGVSLGVSSSSSREGSSVPGGASASLQCGTVPAASDTIQGAATSSSLLASSLSFGSGSGCCLICGVAPSSEFAAALRDWMDYKTNNNQ